jgi:hypothetical protein
MMKTHKLFGIVLLLFFANSHAQEKELPADPEERARQVTEWMKTNFQLNDAQVPKVQAVNYKCAQKNVELENTKLWKNKRQKQLTQNEQYRDAELKKIFTPEQFSAYETRKKEVMTKMMKTIK